MTAARLWRRITAVKPSPDESASSGQGSRGGARSTARRLSNLGLLLGPLALGAQLLASQRPETVERIYSLGLYPRIRGLLLRISSPVPFSLSELLLAGLVLSLVLALWRGLQAAAARPISIGALLVGGAIKLLSKLGWLYFIYCLAWGLNHQRLPFSEGAGWQAVAVDPDELGDLCQELSSRAGALRSQLEEDEAGVSRLPAKLNSNLRASLERGFVAAVELHPGLRMQRLPRAEKPWISALMTRFGVSGIYSPFTAEPHVNSQLPDPMLAFTSAHELAHLAGFAREDESNFIGAMVCERAENPYVRYSGALASLRHALPALMLVDPERAQKVLDGLDPGVRRDWSAISDFWNRSRGPLRDVGRRVNDSYLRSQGHAEGIQSYGRMVDLLLAERSRSR